MSESRAEELDREILETKEVRDQMLQGRGIDDFDAFVKKVTKQKKIQSYGIRKNTQKKLIEAPSPQQQSPQ